MFIETETVDNVISKLTRGKASGVDNLSYEHFQYCHSSVIIILTKFFNLMIKYSYVPSEFGNDIIIPIPKGDTKKAHDKVEDYRGITLSPLVKKYLKIENY